MARIIAVANQKGGVAKTTTTQATAAILKRRGYRVLAVDIDPQGNLSDSIGAVTEDANTICEVLKKEVAVKEAIQSLSVFDILPADISLAGVEYQLPQTGKEYQLQEALKPIKGSYDFILIDTPPSLGILTLNALAAADEVIIPTTAGKFAVKGISELFNTVKSVRRYCNNNLKVSGILFTKFDPRIINNRDIQALVEKLGAALNIPLFKTFIRNRVAVDEAQARSENILDYAACADIVSDYNKLANEILEG